MFLLLKTGLTLIGINVICEVPFYKLKIRDYDLRPLTLTSWLKYDHEIKKEIVYVNGMLIFVNKMEKKF
jgi:hypothetical protein